MYILWEWHGPESRILLYRQLRLQNLCSTIEPPARGAFHCIASYARFRRRADSVRIYKVSGPLLDKWFISF